jgi:hypothetical protein
MGLGGSLQHGLDQGHDLFLGDLDRQRPADVVADRRQAVLPLGHDLPGQLSFGGIPARYSPGLR